MICTLGNFSTKLLTRRQDGITRVHGKPQEHTVAGLSLMIYPIYHPAAGLRSTQMLAGLREDFARLPELLAAARPQPDEEEARGRACGAGGRGAARAVRLVLRGCASRPPAQRRSRPPGPSLPGGSGAATWCWSAESWEVSALDLVLFYLFFEGGLIPMFLIIGVWGGPRRVYASFKFFLYTLLGSVLMLLAIMAMYWEAGTTDIPTLLRHGFPLGLQKWAWFAFFASFAVKMPMWPVHTWLPDAHVEAPTAGSVILAAILLKMGGYGFLRFSLPMFPAASHDFAPLIFTLSVVAIIYTSLVALMQEDVKKLIAYSSVAHMGFVTMGIFAATTQGVAGGIFQMISHGIVSGALFLCVGVVYDRMHTREIAAYGGLVNRMPLYAAVFMVFTLANVGLPGTSGFVGEFLSLIGTFKINIPVATLATLGVILSAAYALWLYRKMIFGKLKPALDGIRDIGWRESVIFAPLVVLTILFGVAPKPVLDMSAASVAQLLDNYKHAHRRRRKTAALVVADERAE